MTRNPYADPTSFDPEPPPTRVSGLAVSSLVFGLLCCIPVVGIVAMILGGSAMVAISRSEGRLTGRGLATTGLVLGLLGTIFTGVIGFVTLQSVAQVQSLTGSYTYAEQQDYNAFRNLFTTAAKPQVTDARIAEFHSKVAAAYGKHLGPTRGLGEVLSGYMEVGPQFQRAPQAAAGQTIPVPMKFEKGRALAFMHINPRQMNSRNMPALENIMVMDPGGNPIWLLPPQTAPTPPAAGPGPSPAPLPPPPEEPKPDAPDPEQPASGDLPPPGSP